MWYFEEEYLMLRGMVDYLGGFVYIRTTMKC